MRSSSPRSLLLTGAAGLGLSLLSALPAAAHGHADASGVAGALHPLLGLDHLVLLVGIGFCGSLTTFSSWVLDVVKLLEAGRPLGAGGLVLGSLQIGVGRGGIGCGVWRGVCRAASGAAG